MGLTTLQNTPDWNWPPDAAKILMGILRDRGSTESDRITAAGLAGSLTVMSDQMADLLLSIARSAGEPDELRATAAISLGPALEDADTSGYEDDVVEPAITEAMFGRIRRTLREVYADESTPKEVRRRVLEASVRSPEDWHRDAVGTAYASGDEDWRLTAVFCMRWIRGFDREILAMLKSPNPGIQCEAVRAAGDWELDAAWPHVATLIASRETGKDLLLAAIEAAADIRPREAREFLIELADSEDEEIAEAADEALMMADANLEEDDDEEEDEELLR